MSLWIKHEPRKDHRLATSPKCPNNSIAPDQTFFCHADPQVLFFSISFQPCVAFIKHTKRFWAPNTQELEAFGNWQGPVEQTGLVLLCSLTFHSCVFELGFRWFRAVRFVQRRDQQWGSSAIVLTLYCWFQSLFEIILLIWRASKAYRAISPCHICHCLCALPMSWEEVRFWHLEQKGHVFEFGHCK